MNRSSLRTRVRSLTNIYSTALLSDSDINTALQDAYSFVYLGAAWPQHMSTTSLNVVPGEATYTLPGSPFEILAVFNAHGVKRTLTPVTPFDLQALSLRAGDTVPVHYMPVLDGATPQLTLIPEPYSVETITVVQHNRPAPLDDDTDVPEFAEEFHAVLTYLAAAQLLTDRKLDPKKVQTMQATAASYLDRMRRHYLISSDRTPVRIANSRRMGWGRWRG